MVTVLFVLFILLQTAFFQNYLTRQLLQAIHTRTQQTAKFTNIRIKWFDFVEITGLEVLDYRGQVMLHADEVTVDYQFSRLLSEGVLQLDGVKMSKGGLYLVNYADSLNINLVEFINGLNALKSGEPRDTLKPAPVFAVSAVQLDEFQFQYVNHLSDSLESGLFDYNHFQLELPMVRVREVALHADTIELLVRTLIAQDRRSGLAIDALRTRLTLTSKSITLADLDLQTPHSHVRDFVQLRFGGFGDLAYFTERVNMTINLQESRIDARDIGFFAKGLPQELNAMVSAQIDGSVPRLGIENLHLRLGERSQIKGSMDLLGLPRLNETFLDARIREGSFYAPDLQAVLGSAVDQIAPIGDIRFSGRFLGFTNDFVANAEFITREGRLQSDLNLKFPQGWENARYIGSVKMDRINVGRILGMEERVGHVTMEGRINGSGLTAKNARFNLKATLTDSEIMGYAYKRIKTDGQFASSFFKGNILIDDPNCQLEVTGNVDLQSLPERVEAVAEVEKLDLQQLGFTDFPLEIETRVEAKFTGLQPDSIQGAVTLLESAVFWNGQFLMFDSARVASFSSGNLRYLTVGMPALSGELKGNFLLTELIQDVSRLSEELGSYFEPSYEKRKAMRTSPPSTNRYIADFSIKYGDINNYLNFLIGDAYISPNGLIEGTYYQRENATLSVHAETDSLYIGGIGLKTNEFDANFSKDLDSLGVLASVLYTSREQIWPNGKSTENLALEGVWDNNHINIGLNISQPETQSSAWVNGDLHLQQEMMVFRFLPSQMVAFGKQWHFNPYNSIKITSSGMVVDRLELYQGEQSLAFTGQYMQNAPSRLALAIRKFDLVNLETFFPISVHGILDTEVELYQADTLSPVQLQSDLSIDQLFLNGFEVGRVGGETHWEEGRKALSLNFQVKRASVRTVDVGGLIYLGDQERLEIDAKLQEVGLELLNPLFEGLLSRIRGKADATLKIGGTLAAPQLTGQATVQEGGFRFDYLGTDYQLNGRMDFTPNAMLFSGMRLTDKDGDRAVLNGAITHQGFKGFNTNLNLAASDFLFLNTTSSDNSLYYGVANATGDISISGPFEDLLIKASATTRPGTRFYIPLTETTDVAQKEYISFVDMSDTTTQVDLQRIVAKSITGITLDFEINVTTDAYVELIFNIRTGDIIRGRGNGNLKMVMDTNGEFELFGDLSITEGAYNFTTAFFNKEFSIVPGGTISWYGDPYQGILNLEATYRQLASFDDLNGTTEATGTAQRHPILVVLKLTGDMLAPSIAFELRMDEGVTQTSEVLGLGAINNDEQELKRQVFSLLILRKFSPKSSFSISGGNAGGSLSEFVSNQLSYYLSQVDENLEVDIDLSAMDAATFNTFQLRLSYSFMGGRLRVSGGGMVPSTEDPGASDFMGDWSVRYLLTRDGHLRVKVFSQTQQIANNFQRESGMSFQYIKSFDDLKELLTKTREEGIRTRPKNMEEEQQANQRYQESAGS